MNVETVGILDTSVATENTGDHIIMESSLRELREVLLPRRVMRFPTHEKMSSTSYVLQKNIDINIACGTNLLHSHMGLIKQWNVGFYDALKLKPVVLLGVGWRSQQKRKTDIYTKWLLKRLLSESYNHSVRDSYAEKQLKNIGIKNVLNTGCPTIWCLNHEHCEKIPTRKGRNAVMVLTDYSKNVELDSELAEMVISNYEKVYYWCQGTKDYEYIKQLGIMNNVIMIPPSLLAYHEFLGDESISLDYVGTRLHGGICALQYKRRAVIIGVDHRANMKGQDFNLPVLDRYVDSRKISRMITENFETRVNLPVEKIQHWKAQFTCRSQ